MGATGRGVRYKKHTVEESYRLDIFALRRNGLLTGGQRSWKTSESAGLTQLRTQVERLGDPPNCLAVTCTSTDVSGRDDLIYQLVDLAIVPCRFGGQRRWFICPNFHCQRRVAKLYIPPGRIEYLCRHCHDLSYAGRQRHRDASYESFGRYGLYRRRLEAARGKQQRRRWFTRLLEAEERITAYNRAYDARFWRRFGRLQRAASSRSKTEKARGRQGSDETILELLRRLDSSS